MTVTKRAASAGAYESSTSLTSPHTTTTNDSITIDASDTILVVFIVVGLQGGSDVSDLAVSAVTVGGTNCTQWPGWKLIGNGGTSQDGIVDAWYLLNPATAPGTGARTVAVTSTFTPGNADHIHTIQQTVAYTGALDGSPIVTAVHNAQGSGTSMTASLVSMASGDLAVGMCANGTSRPGTTTGVEDGGQAATGLLGSGNVEISHNSGTGTVTIVWSTNTADESVYGAGRIVASTGTTHDVNVPAAATASVTANNATITRSDAYVVDNAGAAVADANPSVTFGSTYTPLEGDIIVLFSSSTTVLDVAANANLPAGWVNPLGDGVEIVSDAHGMCVAYHSVTATEQTNVTRTYTATGLTQASETGYVQAVAVRNVDQANIIDGANTAQNSGNTTTPHVLAGITGAGVLIDGSLVVSSVAKDGTGAYSSTPTGWTQVRADNTNQGRWIGYRDANTTLDTDVAATNITPSAGDEYVSITLAFARALAGHNVSVPAAATASMTANNAAHDIQSTVGTCTLTATANNATISVGASAGTCTPSTTANDAAHTIASTVGTATSSTTANDATIQAGADHDVNVPAEAQAAAVANNASISVGASAGTCTAAATANTASLDVKPTGTTATVTITGYDGSHSIASTVTVATLTVTANNATIPGVAFFVASVSTNGHYLKDQNGDPILVQGVTPQNAVPNGTLAEIEDYFSAMHNEGFNSAQIHLVYNFQSDGETSTAPFGNDANLAPQNSGYWGTVDSIFDLAETYGFTLWATVVDNITCGSSIASTSDANCFAYGQFLGARYKDRPNLVWVIGNDFDSTQWSARNGKYGQIVDGIQDQGDTHLLTVWNNQDAADENTYWDTIQTIDNGYEYTVPPYSQVGTAYALTRTGFPKPMVWFEGTYDNEHNAGGGDSTNSELRRLAWFTLTSGGCGHFFGTAKTWVFDTSGSGWASELSGSSAAIYSHLALIPQLFATLASWELLVPDTSHAFHTGGRGTDTSDLATTTLATAAYIDGGVLGLVYFPSSRSSITFDTSQMGGTVTAYWWDPTSGDTAVESNPAAPTHPGNNDGGDGDWVLVFEGTAGTDVNVPAAASGTTTANNASHALELGAGTATSSSTANDAGHQTALGAGPATSTAVANNPGSSIAATVGTAAAAASAFNATISTEARTDVNVPAAAAVSATANNAALAVKPTGTSAAVIVTANNAAPSVPGSAQAESATVTATAYNATIAISASAGTCTAQTTANDAAHTILSVVGYALALAQAFNAGQPAPDIGQVIVTTATIDGRRSSTATIDGQRYVENTGDTGRRSTSQ